MKIYRPDGALRFFILLSLVGCGSSEGGPGADGGGGAPVAGSGTLVWTLNGQKHTALYPAGARVISSMMDMVQVSGGDPGGAGISFGVSMPPPLAPGTYPCGVSGNRIIVSMSAASGSVFTTCSVTLASIGAKTGDQVKGTFSGSGGGTTVTDGSFDVKLTVNMF